MWRLLARHRAIILGDIIDAGRALGHGEKGRLSSGIDMQGCCTFINRAGALQLGYAPAEWKSLFNHLNSKGFKAEEIERAGLIVRSQNSKFQSQNYYDRFRSRIMFPIFDYSGRVVAFTGRIFPP